MILSNYHSHCYFCDGRSYPENYVQFALSKKFRAYGFSSHAPLPFETNWNMSFSDMPEYLREIDRLKRKYDGEIEIYTALEIDYLDDTCHANLPYFRDLPLDYRIGSVHFMPVHQPLIEKNMATVDGSLQDYRDCVRLYFHDDIHAYVENYFKSINGMMDRGGIDIVGHIDKIYMHGQHFEERFVDQPWYRRFVEESLAKVADKGLMLEINTKNWNSKHELYPHESFLPLIKELQIPVMVNSDCHYPDLINDGRAAGFEMLKQAGFTSTMELVKGIWTPFEI